MTSNPKLSITVPDSTRMSSGELRDWIIVFRTLGEDIEILEKREEIRDAKIVELEKVIGRLDSLCSNLPTQLEAILTEVRREIRSLRT